MEGFEVLDISGDVGLKISGGSLSELYENAGHGLYSLITDINSVERKTSLSIHVAGDTPESLLIAFLNELIFQFDTNGFIGKDITINQIKESSIDATVSGEEFDPEKHEKRLLVKAATYHNISVKKSEGMWTASVVFDI